MSQLSQIWKCNVCGNIVEILHEGSDSLVCCGKPMELLEEKTEEEGKEKHVPVIKARKEKIKVRVGEIKHPMETEHYIEFIEIIGKRGVEKKFLKPGEEPEAEFCNDEVVKVRAYCNIHGLWKDL